MRLFSSHILLLSQNVYVQIQARNAQLRAAHKSVKNICKHIIKHIIIVFSKIGGGVLETMKTP